MFFGGFGISSKGGVLRGVMARTAVFPQFLLLVFQVERRMKAENEEHVHFKSLGVSEWKAKRCCDKNIQVKSRQDSLVCFFV